MSENTNRQFSDQRLICRMLAGLRLFEVYCPSMSTKFSHSTNSALKAAADVISLTRKHLFLTGKAGTGKTTFLKDLPNLTDKRFIVVAPTGVAAMNAGGVTIHSFFQLPFGPQIPEELTGAPGTDNRDVRTSAARFHRFTREKLNIIRSIDMLVIDEISMVRADMLDAIDTVLRRVRRTREPFGGVQLVMIGDMQQLAPIAKNDEWSLLSNYYDSAFFFSSKALQKTDYLSIELTEIYRQKDRKFIEILNSVRDNRLNEETMSELMKRYIPGFSPDEREGYITLTTHNHQAYKINQAKLSELKTELYSFKAVVEGDFPESGYPTDPILQLKSGAQVMFVKNDPSPEKAYFNGKIGRLLSINPDSLSVLCSDDQEPIQVNQVNWQNCRYSLNEDTGVISETVIGSFRQYPLKTAWAVTIHKSQGLTFEKAIIDAQQAFAHGQVYVALSRCRSLSGLVLSSPIQPGSLKSDSTITDFTRDIENRFPDGQLIQKFRLEYQKSLVMELFDFSLFHNRIGYLIKLLRENPSSIDQRIMAAFHEIERKLKSRISSVSEKFMIEVNQILLENPDVEVNQFLQERIRKACCYFHTELEAVLPGSVPEIEIDNKAVRKSVDEQITRILNDTSAKQACLSCCKAGFSIPRYLETRAKSSIEKGRKPQNKSGQTATLENISHPQLLAKLKNWRNALALKKSKPVYRIIQREAMHLIADRLPLSRIDLLAIKGIGRRKIEEFGDAILEIIQEYIAKTGLSLKIDETPLNSHRAAKGKNQPQAKEVKSTREVTLDLFRQGKTIEEAASSRGLSISTIENHLAHYVATGVIEVTLFVSPEKLNMILEHFQKTDCLALGPAKAALGEGFSWTELRFAAGYYQFRKIQPAKIP